jgi:5-methylcytosine-specific restriction enzyme A
VAPVTVGPLKLCTVCGVPTSRPGSRCTEHARQSNRSRHNALYSTPAWQRLSARVLRAWRGEHGDWCPGYGRPAHPARDLTVDHVVPLAAGGAPFEISNCAVLCRSCNSTKGASPVAPDVASQSRLRSGVSRRASSDPGGVDPMGTEMPPDRASRLCIRGRVLPFLSRCPTVRPHHGDGERPGNPNARRDQRARSVGGPAWPAPHRPRGQPPYG